ncbi:MAG: sulfotransferase [Planctomycetes bacterium]|nr:sulfotransferase [Planctomycetota bacterium]
MTANGNKYGLIMISAMYENGGNTTHRIFDGHPQLLTYPFESQLGTATVADYLHSTVPFRYRWPVLPMEGNFADDFELLYDEELKCRLRVPRRSKFFDADLQMSEEDRKATFLRLLEGKQRTRANVVHAFFQATFDSWKNIKRSGQEKAFLGYSPVICMDSERILADFPDAHILHVVRNPYSGYADTKKRPYPLSLERYVWTWNFQQLMALTYRQRYPKSLHILRYEDMVADRKKALGPICEQLGLGWSDTLMYPSWNGEKLNSVFPWGTIVQATTEANIATMNELSAKEKAQVKSIASVMKKQLGYDDM